MAASFQLISQQPLDSRPNTSRLLRNLRQQPLRRAVVALQAALPAGSRDQDSANLCVPLDSIRATHGKAMKGLDNPTLATECTQRISHLKCRLPLKGGPSLVRCHLQMLKVST